MTTSPDHRHRGATAAALLCRVVSVEAQMQARRTLDDAGVEMASPNRRRIAWRRGDVSMALSDRAETFWASLRRRVRIAERCPDAVVAAVRP